MSDEMSERTANILFVVAFVAFVIILPVWTYLEGERIGQMRGFNDCMAETKP